MKKKCILTIIFLALLINANAQNTNWLWAKSLGGTVNYEVRDMCALKNGEVIVIGWLWSNTPLVLGTYTFVATGLNDYIVVKYDASGNVVWALANGGSVHVWTEDICVDDSGNIYITGGYLSTTITFGNTTYTNTTGSDKFLLKYNASGAFQWVKFIGGWLSYITTDSFGNLYMAGQFNAPLVIGTNTFVNSQGGSDIYLAKYNSSGNLIWALSTGGTANDALNSIHIDANDNIVLTGYFVGDTTVFGNSVLVSGDTASKGDLFLAKYNSSGSFLWGKNIGGGTEIQQALSTTSDLTGNIYCTGVFTSPNLSFGTTTLNNSSNSQNNADMFVAKFSPLGNLIWAKNETGPGDEVGNNIIVDAVGNVYVAGFFYGSTMSMGTGMYTNTDTLGTTRDIVVMRYDAFGNLLWSDHINGNKEDRVINVSMDGNSNVYLAGSFLSDQLSFDSNTLQNANPTPPKYDYFLAKLKTNLTNRIEKQTITNIEIFPNPVRDYLNIRIEKDVHENYSISIANLLGQILYFNNELVASSQLQSIDLSFLNSGVYIMTINDAKNQEQFKMVKE